MTDKQFVAWVLFLFVVFLAMCIHVISNFEWYMLWLSTSFDGPPGG